MAFKDKFADKNANDNKYDGGYFCVKDNILFTTYAAIPLENISKIWIHNIAKRVKLGQNFWICAILGILGGIFSFSDDSIGFVLFTPSLLLLSVAFGLFLYVVIVNSNNEYGLCIESNSGSVEMYTNANLQILFNAQIQLEKGITALKKGTTYNITYDLSTGQISNDIIIHGNNYGPAVTGKDNTASTGSNNTAVN